MMPLLRDGQNKCLCQSLCVGRCGGLARALYKRKAYSYLLGRIFFMGLPKYLLLQTVILAQEYLNG